MMKKLLLIVLLLGMHLSVLGQVQFWSDDFEDPTSPSSGIRTPSNNGGSSSAYFKRATNADLDLTTASDGNYSNFQGTYFWAGEDHDGPFANDEQNIVWSGINITGKTGITFKGLFGAQSTNDAFENVLAGYSHSDYVIVEYSIDGGIYVPLISFYSTTDIENKKLYEDTNNDGIGDGTLLTKSFQEFSKSISGTGNQLTIRLRAYSNNTFTEEWAVDNFRLSATESNAAPTATAPSVPSVEEDDTNVALSNDIQISDADGDGQTVTFTITGGTLTLGTSGITFGGGMNGSSSFTALGTLANINAALDAATFTPTPDLYGPGVATISFISNDGTDNSNTASVTFDIAGVNDDPTIIGLPSSITVEEDATEDPFDISAATIGDIDAESGELTITLEATGGIFDIAAGTGITITGHMSGLLTLTGNLTDLNNYINSPSNIYFRPDANLNGNGAASVEVSINDNGNTGSGGGNDIAIGTVSIDITPVNDAPTASGVAISGTLTVGEELNGTYTYADVDNDAESGSTYQWYRADDDGGTGKTAITGAENQDYTLQAADQGKYISFEVTPNDGTLAGTAVESDLEGPVKIGQTITFPSIPTKTYGDASFTLGDAQTDQGLTVTYTSDDPTVVDITGNQATILTAGSTQITATQSGDGTTQAATPVAHTLTVNQATLTVTADDQSKVYGEADPALTVSYDGFENGDDESDLGGTLNVSRAAGEDVGDYAINASGQTSANYTINYVAGNLEITSATLTVTAEDKSKVYGEADPSLTVSYAGFVNGDDATALGGTLDLSRATGEDVGNYAVMASGYSSSNYMISYVEGNFEITQAALTVTADDKSKVYGSTDPGLTVSYAGFVNGDDATALGGTLDLSRATGEDVGNYAVMASGYSSSNYTISYVEGNFEITQAALTVTADDQSKVYGAADPSLTVSYSGFVNSDDETVLGGTLDVSRTAGEDVGNYAITASGYTSGNYTISYVDGNFEITQAALTVTANGQSKVYGEADGALTVSYSGFVNSDDATVLGGTLDVSRAAGEDVGNYAITASGYTSGNYTISYVDGNFEITKAALTVTADDQSKVYGEADGALTVSYSGFANGDDATVLGGTLDVSRTAGEDVGNYAITASGYTSGNYTISYVDGNFEITKAALTVMANDQNKVYGEADGALTVSYSGFVNGDDETALGGTLAISRTAGEDVGNYAITASGYTSGNYTISYVDGNFEITKAALTVTADDQSKVYGAADPSLTVSYSGFVNSDDATALGGTLDVSRTAGEDVGTYAITASGYTSGNYTISFVDGSFEITQAALTVTADDQSKVYGAADPNLTVSYSGFVNGDDATVLGGTLDVSRAAGEDVGTYAITASGYTSGNYTISFVDGSFEITQAALTVTADDQSKVYGAADPNLTVSYSGFVNGDDATVLGGTLDVSRAAGEDVGTYAITASGYTSGNYTISYVDGNFEITQAALTVTADDQSKVYGAADPSLTVSYSGFVNSDDATALGGTLDVSRAAGEDVGNYAITASGYTSGNYTISYVDGNLEITKAALTVTADDQSKVYGAADPSLTVSYSGFVNGDDATALGGTLNVSRAAGEDVGSYAITASGYTSGNYTISYVDGNLEITKAALTVTADDQSKVYGAADPSLTVSYSGFVNGDDATALGGTLNVSRAAGEDVGSYAITASGYTSGNYTISYVDGNLEITQASLTVTADEQSKVYGEADGALTVSYSGFVNGDDATVLGGTLDVSRAAGEDVGTYVITASGYTSGNYTISYVDGNLEITQAALTVTADDQSKVYGAADPSLTVSYSGFANGDDATALGGTLDVSRVAGEDVGNYAITSSGYTSGNYTISYVDGNLEITQAALTVTADDQSKVYGEADGALTVSYSGFVNSDDETVLGGTLDVSRAAGEDVGNYAITASGYTSPNYTISYVDGNLEITKAVLTVTADDQSKVYGETDPALTVSYSGFVNGDDETALGGTLAISRTAGEDVGKYAIIASGYTSGNYTISYVDGNFEISQAALTVIADDQSKVYGETDGALTVSYSGFVNGDDATVLGGTLTVNRAAGEDVGNYAISASGYTSGNYTISFVDGSFEITQAALTVTADDQSKVYGEADGALTVSYSGFVNGDDATVLGGTLAISRAAGEDVGTYEITASGYTSGNYTISYVDGNFEITKAALTVSADDQSKVYGEVDGALTVSYSGFVNGDDATALGGTLAISRAAGEDVGNYAITASGYTSGNYTISYVDGNLEITQAALTVTADDQSKVYGEADGALTVSYSGFVNGDDKTALGGTLAISRTAGEDVGNYAITASGYTSGNYTISYVNGNFEITKAALTVTADDQSKVYGEVDGALTVSYSGFANSDDATVLGGTLDMSRTAGEDVGNYAITASGYTSGNYTISYVDGNLEITQAALTVTADDQSKVYGEADGALTVSYSGFVNGDDATALGGTLAISRAAGEDVGNYAITASGYTSGNYTISYVDGNLEITQAALTVTADDQSKVYGEVDGALTVSYSGFVNGDDKTALGGTLAISRTAGEDVGNYAITASGYTSSNYTISYVNGNFEITQASLTVSADDQSKVYGTVDPILSYTASGFVNGDDDGILTGGLSRAAGEDIGVYAINLGSLSAGDNYNIVYQAASLTILARKIEEVYEPTAVTVDWGIDLVEIPLPETVLVRTEQDEFINLEVNWNVSTVDTRNRGAYRITGTLQLPGTILGEGLPVPFMFVNVNAKPAPVDLVLDNNSFEAQNGPVAIGSITVVDPVDNQHVLELVSGAADNGYFSLSGNSLYWDSQEALAGRTAFSVEVMVVDADGNTLSKVFEVNRLRKSLNDIVIYNTFSPNEDGTNDTWGVEELRYQTGVRIMIFEKSGNRLFYTENPEKRWDGTYKGKEMAVGSYFWVIESKEDDKVRRGTLNLLK
ncbi:gliding motility-associated C-terminal domain-containing protein [Echinicola marina]|uniref:MBG domain-containing protein n=1 Tax=Echinicola marina TaxID=2859768 RepID=UPI001CF68838|nr:MBG domain-containing protein [Echinicola marina]UCS92362.1 gliding motility-associated C-terminal domain-containing protein [Echinicola marina]